MKKITLRKVLIIIAAAALLLTAAAVGMFFYFTSKLDFQSFETAETEEGAEAVKTKADEDGVINILLIGADNDVGSGMDSPGNADGLVIVSINPDTKKITLTSLMRDIRVLKDNGYATKITIAYHDGGPELLIKCIEENLGIYIDNYVRLTYPGVVKIIDAAGGVKMELYEDELYHMQEKIEAISKTVGVYWGDQMLPLDQPGVHKLNGIQAAAFMRVRLAGNGDYERTERARRVLLALKDNVAKMGPVRLVRFANVVLPCITTDMDRDDIAGHLTKLGKYFRYDFVSNRIPVDDSFYYSNEGGAYTVIDFDVNREHFYETVYTEKQRAKLFPEEETD